MDECIIEGGKDMRDAKDKFTFPNLRTETYGLFLLGDLLLRRLSLLLVHMVQIDEKGDKGTITIL